MNLPNFLTLARFFLAPLISYLILTENKTFALIIFVLAILTDLLDGFIARKYSLVTKIGSHLDRWADKLLAGFVIFALFFHYQYYVWMAVYALGVVAFFVGNIYFVKKRLKVSIVGKVMVWLQAILLAIMIYGYTTPFTIVLFSLLLIIPAIGYIRKIVH